MFQTSKGGKSAEIKQYEYTITLLFINPYAQLHFICMDALFASTSTLGFPPLTTLCYWLNGFPQDHNWLEHLEKPSGNIQLKLMTFLNGIKQQYLKIYQHEIKVNPQGTHH